MEELLRWFEYSHLPEAQQRVSRQFFGTARFIAGNLRGTEARVALRKLLEAKDCAVRASLTPPSEEVTKLAKSSSS
jgi:hypothetical protein